MADTGFVIPGSDHDYPPASQMFQNRVNARTDNTSYSALSTSTSSNGSYWGTFGFSVPAGATIDGIEIRIRARDIYDGAGATLSTRPVLDGSTTPDNGTLTERPASGALPLSATSYTVGGPTDLLGLTPTVDQINATDFYIFVQANSSDGFEEDCGLELIEAKIYYTAAGGGGANPKGVLGGLVLGGPFGGPL